MLARCLSVCVIAMLPSVSEAYHYPGEHMTDYKFSSELPILADKFRSYESPVGYPFTLINWCRHEADIANDPNGDKPITEKIM